LPFARRRILIYQAAVQLILIIVVSFLIREIVQADETVTVNASVDLGEITLRESGFLHGIETGGYLDDSLVAALKPTNWRLYKFSTLDFARHFNPRITYGLSNHYAWSQGGFPYARPWENWQEYEDYILNELIAIAAYFPDVDIEFYDIWNEPDHPYFWTGTYEQLLELFARAHNIVKFFDPGAKLVGPSVSWFRPDNPGVENIIGFLADLDRQYGIRMDAISWHENGGAFHGGPRPEQIPINTSIIRSRLQQQFPPEYQPELHINEYSGTQEHLSPGWNVGYLYYLEETDIDAAMRACWWIYSGDEPPYDYWCDCWFGLNGMFMQDGLTPQPSYWIYKAYADMKGYTRIDVSCSEPTTCMLASKNDQIDEVQLLVGRYWYDQPSNVIVNIEGYPYPYSQVHVSIGRIPHHPDFYENPPIAHPLPNGPIPIAELDLAVLDSSLIFILDYFEDGDAYTIVISGNQTSGIDDDTAKQVYCNSLSIGNSPNPFNSKTTFSYTLPFRSKTNLEIYNLCGERVSTLVDKVQEQGSRRIVWDASGFSSGIYFYKLTAGNNSLTKRMILLK